MSAAMDAGFEQAVPAAQPTTKFAGMQLKAPISQNARSFFVISYIVLIGDTARGIIWPTLYPLLIVLGGSSATLGWCVATFSIGRVVGSPFFGWLSARIGPALTLQFSLLIFALGAAIYALVRPSRNCTLKAAARRVCESNVSSLHRETTLCQRFSSVKQSWA